MRTLTSGGRFYPTLFDRLETLPADALERVEAAMLPPLRSHLVASYLEVVRALGRIAREQAVVDLDDHESKAQRRVLEDMQLLMHRLCAIGELLRNVAKVVLPAPGRKNKAAQLIADRLDYRLERNFKLPINMVKHQAFRLEWLTVAGPHLRSQGYCVRGPVARQHDGPLRYRPKDRNSPEAYSFAYVLRDGLLALFDLAEALEHVLAGATYIFDAPAPLRPSGCSEEVAETLEALNALPRYGFFDESALQIPLFDLHNGAIVATMRRVRSFRTGARITSSLHTVAGGVKYQMPYLKSP